MDENSMEIQSEGAVKALAEPIVKVESYNIEISEEEKAFKIFQKKYTLKANIIKTVLFGVVFVLFIEQIVRDPSYAIAWCCAGVCAGMIFFTWYSPVKIRKSLLQALEVLKDDRYVFSLFDDSFMIETILPDDSEFKDKDEDGNVIETEPIEPRTVTFSDTRLDCIETEDMFIFLVKKDTIFVLPKRAMSEGQIEKTRSVLSGVLGDKYETPESKKA